jgi:hypothetical protein
VRLAPAVNPVMELGRLCWGEIRTCTELILLILSDFLDFAKFSREEIGIKM